MIPLNQNLSALKRSQIRVFANLAKATPGCASLTSVTIPQGVKTIGERAFYGCGKLASALLPKGVKTIGAYAFLGVTALGQNGRNIGVKQPPAIKLVKDIQPPPGLIGYRCDKRGGTVGVAVIQSEQPWKIAVKHRLVKISDLPVVKHAPLSISSKRATSAASRNSLHR